MVNTFQTPTTILLAGCSQAGKSSFVKRLLDHRDVMFSTPPESVIYFYGVHQPLFEKMSDVQFHNGLPENFEKFAKPPEPRLFILDDLILDSVSNKNVGNLVSRGVHHLNCSLLIISQNLYQQGKVARLISLNTHYLILFRSMRDGQTIVNLGKQLYPGRGNLLVESYREAMKEKYSYLLIDMHPHSNSSEPLLSSKIFPGEGRWTFTSK